MPNSRRLALLPLVLLAVLAALAGLACNVFTSRGTPTPSALASPTKSLPGPTATPAPTDAATAGPTDTSVSATGTEAPATNTEAATAAASQPPPTRVATSPTTIKLASAGPWLVFSAADGVWAANPDGSGLTQLMPAAPYLRLGPAAPRGGHVSVLTGSDGTGFHGLTLWLLSLPGGDLKKITALTDASTEPDPNADPQIDVLTPLGQAAWSPDGASLAFIGAQAGPSADLFSYQPASGQVTRLTDGASQAFGPSWSPDGKYVLQFGARTFGSGAGYSMDGVWAAAADNSRVKLLYKPDSGGEEIVGWPGPETFAVTSFYAQCSYGKTRTFNIANGQSQAIFPGYYTHLAADPASGAALAVVDKFVAECDPGAKQGLFLARPGAAPKLLDENAGDATNVGWSAEAGVFYAFTDAGWVAYTPDGQPATLPDGLNGEPLVAAGGKNWAWLDQASGELQASLGGAPARRVFAGGVQLPTWSLDGQTLLFFGDGQLYAAAAPGLQAQARGEPKTLSDTDRLDWVK